MIQKIPDYQLEKNKVLSELKGRKIVLFTAYHSSGVVNIQDSIYEDYAWVPKAKLRDYLSKENFERVNHLFVE